MTKSPRTRARIGLALVPLGLVLLLVLGITDLATRQQLFVHTTYYLLMALVLCWTGTHIHAARGARPADVVAWLKENWPGLVVAGLVTAVVGLAVEPGLRMLSDEANLVGTSKNL